MSDDAALLARVEELQRELEESKQSVAALRKPTRNLNREFAAPLKPVSPPITEIEETLRRLVAKIAAILQAEKCVFMLLTRKRASWWEASRPSPHDDELKRFHVRATQGYRVRYSARAGRRSSTTR